MDRHSLALAEFLVSAYPEWVDDPGAVWETDASNDDDPFIRIASRCGRADGDLLLWFDGSEIVVQFTGWHGHFDVNPASEHFALQALRLTRWLDAFLADREVIVNVYKNDKWCGSTSLSIGYGATLSQRCRDGIGHFIFRLQAATHYEIRSWSGGLDEKHRLTPGGWETEGGRAAIPEPSEPLIRSVMTSIHSASAAEPLGPYAHARRAGNLLFLSGIGPRKRGSKDIPGAVVDATGNLADYSIEAEMRSCFENIRIVLEEAGSRWEKIVDVAVYLTDMKRDWKEYNRVYAEFFKAPNLPTRTTVEVKSLPTGGNTPIHFEIKVVAEV